MRFVVSLFKGTTLNKKRRLDHESHRHPETRILKYHGYRFSPTSEQVKSAVVNVYIISRVIACLLGNKARLSSAKPTPASV